MNICQPIELHALKKGQEFFMQKKRNGSFYPATFSCRWGRSIYVHFEDDDVKTKGTNFSLWSYRDRPLAFLECTREE
jgi:hypothetical protein